MGVARVKRQYDGATRLRRFGPSLSKARVGAPWCDSAFRPYWGETTAIQESEPALRGRLESDLTIVGGGFTGLWVALHVKQQ